MKVLLIDNGSSLLSRLQKLIPGDEIVQKYDAVSDAQDCDLIVLSGGPHNVKRESFDNEVALIKSGKPIIGICLGCELIGHVFGGEINELPKEQKGINEIDLLDAKLGGPEKIRVYEGHKQYISKLPEDFEILARSENGPEIIKHKSLPVYGLQFHPEHMVDETDGDEHFLNLLKQF